MTDRSWQRNAFSWCPWLDGAIAVRAHKDALMAFFYCSWQFWLPRPHLHGTSDGGAQRERHHSGLTTTDSSRTLCDFLSVLVLAADMTRLQVVLWDCPSLAGWPESRPSADERLMLQQSPHHSASCSSVCSLSSELGFTLCYMWTKILWVQCILVLHNPLPVTFGNRSWCTYLRALWGVGIHNTYILFRESKFNVIRTVYVILMFISTLGITLFLTSTHSGNYLLQNCLLSTSLFFIVTNYLLQGSCGRVELLESKEFLFWSYCNLKHSRGTLVRQSVLK